MIVVFALVYDRILIPCDHGEQSINIGQFSVERLEVRPSDLVTGVSPINVSMAAEPWIPTGFLEMPDQDSGKRQKTVSEQMDEDLEDGAVGCDSEQRETAISCGGSERDEYDETAGDTPCDAKRSCT